MAQEAGHKCPDIFFPVCSHKNNKIQLASETSTKPQIQDNQITTERQISYDAKPHNYYVADSIHT